MLVRVSEVQCWHVCLSSAMSVYVGGFPQLSVYPNARLCHTCNQEIDRGTHAHSPRNQCLYRGVLCSWLCSLLCSFATHLTMPADESPSIESSKVMPGPGDVDMAAIASVPKEATLAFCLKGPIHVAPISMARAAIGSACSVKRGNTNHRVRL